MLRTLLTRSALVVYACIAGLGVLTLTPEQDLLVLPAVTALCAVGCWAASRLLDDLGDLSVVTWTGRLAALVPFVAGTRLFGATAFALVVGVPCLIAWSPPRHRPGPAGRPDRSRRQAVARVTRELAGLHSRPLSSLVDEWEDTQRQLTGPGSRLFALALRRAGLLDELEARDPVGFTTWLFAGSASGYPLREFFPCPGPG